jgi:hypothetical protein
MRISDHFVILILASLLVANPVIAQMQLAHSPRILSAKSVYLSNRAQVFDDSPRSSLYLETF